MWATFPLCALISPELLRNEEEERPSFLSQQARKHPEILVLLLSLLQSSESGVNVRFLHPLMNDCAQCTGVCSIWKENSYLARSLL